MHTQCQPFLGRQQPAFAPESGRGHTVQARAAAAFLREMAAFSVAQCLAGTLASRAIGPRARVDLRWNVPLRGGECATRYMFQDASSLATVEEMRWTAGPVYLGGRARERSGASVIGVWALQAGDRMFEISSDPFIVGRGSDVDLQLQDANVSRRHAAFRIEDGPAVEDLKSMNGTYVNRQPIVGRVLLQPGDRIVLGSCQLRLVRAASIDALVPGRVTQPMSEAPAGADSLAALSPREREVFALFAEGLSQREIASSFSVSVKTVETYRTRIGQKLGIRSRADLIRCALAAGVLRPESDN